MEVVRRLVGEAWNPCGQLSSCLFVGHALSSRQQRTAPLHKIARAHSLNGYPPLKPDRLSYGRRCWRKAAANIVLEEGRDARHRGTLPGCAFRGWPEQRDGLVCTVSAQPAALPDDEVGALLGSLSSPELLLSPKGAER